MVNNVELMRKIAEGRREESKSWLAALNIFLMTYEMAQDHKDLSDLDMRKWQQAKAVVTCSAHSYGLRLLFHALCRLFQWLLLHDICSCHSVVLDDSHAEMHLFMWPPTQKGDAFACICWVKLSLDTLLCCVPSPLLAAAVRT